MEWEVKLELKEQEVEWEVKMDLKMGLLRLQTELKMGGSRRWG